MDETKDVPFALANMRATLGPVVLAILSCKGIEAPEQLARMSLKDLQADEDLTLHREAIRDAWLQAKRDVKLKLCDDFIAHRSMCSCGKYRATMRRHRGGYLCRRCNDKNPEQCGRCGSRGSYAMLHDMGAVGLRCGACRVADASESQARGTGVRFGQVRTSDYYTTGAGHVVTTIAIPDNERSRGR